MKILIGKVISNKMSKTATVLVERTVIHPIYLKRFRRTKKFHVHDEFGAKVGDSVKFAASKPFSKLVKWNLLEVVNLKKDQSMDKSKDVKVGKEKKGK